MRGLPPYRCAPWSARRCDAAGRPRRQSCRGQSESCADGRRPGLIECGYGDWTGKTLRELSKEKLWRRCSSSRQRSGSPAVRR